VREQEGDGAGSWEEEANADKERSTRQKKEQSEGKLQSLPSDKHGMDRKIFSDVARLRAHGVPLESYIEMYHIGFCIQEIKYHIGYGDVTSTGNIGIANPGKQTTRSAWLATSTLLRKIPNTLHDVLSVFCFFCFYFIVFSEVF